MQLNKEHEIINPNLPDHKVKTVLISSKAVETISFLERIDINCIKIYDNNKYLLPLQSHPDMQYMHFGQGVHFAQNKELQGDLSKIVKCELLNDVYSKEYPGDVKLNGVIIGNRFICNEKTISKHILEMAYKADYTIINTNQGYTKCSVCIIDHDSIITDDHSIYKSVRNYFSDVLLITKGSIVLNDMNYGFIGGCSGKISKNEIVFNGEIMSHPDHNEIIDFIIQHNCRITETKSGQLEDIGSILPITEIN